MRKHVRGKLEGRQLLAVMVAMGALLAIAFAATGGATVPPTGVNCQLDGKISGRGATFATRAQTAFANGFRDDVCGKVTDAKGDQMVIYNYDSITGSGNGQKGQSCRTDAFGGSDIPYDNPTLTSLNGAAGSLTTCSTFTTQAGFTASPYQPTPGPYPDASDATAPIMSFPVAGSAVAVGINLQAADCGGTKPASLSFTNVMVSRLFGGEIKTWDDAFLRSNGLNAALANCHGAITRVVRFDKSGTTQVFKNYLVNADNARSSQNCVPGQPWSFYAQDANNQTWPTSADATCTTLTTAGSNGAGALLTKCTGTAGAICYADIPDMVGAPTLIRASLRNATDTAYASPSTSSRANCNFGTLTLPGTNDAGAVGLDTTDDWATDNASGNHGNVTFQGSQYPACGVTFALVFAGLNSGLSANPIGRLNADQRQTLYAYESYILSSAGQDKLSTVFYTGLPPAIVTVLRRGFQANY